MNDEASKLSANAPAAKEALGRIAPASSQNAAPAGVSAKGSAASGGSPLKLVIPIALLVAVIFGITFFAQYSPPTRDDEVRTTGGESAVEKGEPPLRFGSSIRMWDPRSLNLQDHIFPGFYEAGEELNNASFWLENRNPAPVSMRLIKVSCTRCSAGRLTSFAPEVTDQLIMSSVLSGFPQGLFNALPLDFAAAAANVAPDRLDWKEYTYKDPNNPHPQYVMAAAPGAGHLISSRWGIFELLFQVAGPGQKQLKADFGLQVEGTKSSDTTQFAIDFEGVDAFEVSRNFIDVGDWTENTEPRVFSFIVYSMTRGPHRTERNARGDLGIPIVDIRMPGNLGDPGPFVSVSAPVRVPESELIRTTNEVYESLATKKKVRVESAYRYTVTVTPKVGDKRLDIGLLERDIFLAFKDIGQPKQIRVKGMVRGSVWLDNNRNDIDLPVYRSTEGVSHSVRLIAEQPDTVVELVKDECTPRFAQYRLNKLPPDSDRGYYELKVDVPKGSTTGSWNGVIVLEIKGIHPQRIRIPIRGVAKF